MAGPGVELRPLSMSVIAESPGSAIYRAGSGTKSPAVTHSAVPGVLCASRLAVSDLSPETATYQQSEQGIIPQFDVQQPAEASTGNQYKNYKAVSMVICF